MLTATRWFSLVALVLLAACEALPSAGAPVAPTTAASQPEASAPLPPIPLPDPSRKQPPPIWTPAEPLVRAHPPSPALLIAERYRLGMCACVDRRCEEEVNRATRSPVDEVRRPTPEEQEEWGAEWQIGAECQSKLTQALDLAHWK